MKWFLVEVKRPDNLSLTLSVIAENALQATEMVLVGERCQEEDIVAVTMM